MSQIPYDQLFKQRVWSKVGAKGPFLVGFELPTIEDFLRYGLLFFPGWSVVANKQVVSDKVLKCVQDLGDPACYT